MRVSSLARIIGLALLWTLPACRSEPTPEEAERIRQMWERDRLDFERAKQRAMDGRQRTAQSVARLQASLGALRAALPPAASFSEDRV